MLTSNPNEAQNAGPSAQAGPLQDLTEVDAAEFHRRLQACGHGLFGAREGNDCVWVSIAHLLGMSLDTLKRQTGLTPAPGVQGITNDEILYLLRSLNMNFYCSAFASVGNGVRFARSKKQGFWTMEIIIEMLDKRDATSFGICYTRPNGTGHCVVYERVSLEERSILDHFRMPNPRSPWKFALVDYTYSPPRSALDDMEGAEINLVFHMGAGRPRPVMQPLLSPVDGEAVKAAHKRVHRYFNRKK